MQVLYMMKLNTCIKLNAEVAPEYVHTAKSAHHKPVPGVLCSFCEDQLIGVGNIRTLTLY